MDVKNNLSENLMVCEHCLSAIESHEGAQITKKHYIDVELDENNDIIETLETRCDWCEGYGFDVLVELL